jgi:cytochrome b
VRVVPRRLPAEAALNDAVRPRDAWDLPTRVFHWSLATLVVFSYITGKAGGPWLEWHMRSGYAILALLLFRLGWAFAGPANARFVSFVRGPRVAWKYARALLAGTPDRFAGHNPLGGWMVVVMLASLAIQAATGLFSDDDSSHSGPLAAKVSEAAVARMSNLHYYNQWLLVALVALHVAAIGWYQWRLHMDLTRPMVLGQVDAGTTAFGAVLLAAAAAAVYWLVVVYPR